MLFATKKHARACAQLIRSRATAYVSTFLFGSVARWGFGRDIDLLLEVDPPVFRRYLTQTLDYGVHSYLDYRTQKEMVADYYAVSELRTLAVLECIGCSGYNSIEKGLEQILSFSRIDLLCVPADWRIPTADSRRGLDRLVSDRDARFFEKLQRAATPL